MICGKPLRADLDEKGDAAASMICGAIGPSGPRMALRRMKGRRRRRRIGDARGDPTFRASKGLASGCRIPSGQRTEWGKGVPGFHLLSSLLSLPLRLSGSSRREGERASVPTVGSGPPRHELAPRRPILPARIVPPPPPSFSLLPAAPRRLADRLSSRQRWPRPRDLTAPPGGWGEELFGSSWPPPPSVFSVFSSWVITVLAERCRCWLVGFSEA
ncbi:hypothetical protein NL676_020459 [Syzygium grande]|nr:hypothetical protein NL676_020459 [Syzygium grande]